MSNDRFERALGIAGVEYAKTLLGGKIRGGGAAGGDLWIQSHVKPHLSWYKETTQIEVKASSLWWPAKCHSSHPCFRFANLMRDVEHVLLIGSMRLRSGCGIFTYANGLVVRDTGPLIVNPWLFFFTLADALDIGLAHNTAAITYTPFHAHKNGKWSRLLGYSRFTPTELSALHCQL
jgi:hypothetical protein